VATTSTTPAPPSRARPPAPEVSFAKRGGPTTHPVEPSLPLEQTGASAWPTVTCTLCGTANRRGLRFCMACGRPIAGADEDSSIPIGAIELMRTIADAPRPEVAPTPVGGAPPIAPARVIEVGPAAGPSNQLSCPRCRGAYDPGAQFCRFCGLPLAGLPQPAAAAVTPQPRAFVSASPTSPRGIRASVDPASVRTPSAPSASAARRLASDALPGRGPHPGGAPDGSPVLARVVLITRDGSEGASHKLGASTDLGRVEGDILFPDDQYISPRHARIAARGGAFFVRDLESTNGVFVRIPFAAHAQDSERGRGQASGEGPDEEQGQGQGQGQEEDKTTIRGHHSEPLSQQSQIASEQPLADQDLFLVGQQVLRFEVVKQAEEAFGAASENGTLLFGTPTAPRYARLSQRTVEGIVRDIFHLRRAETVIGRESGDVVFTDDPFLSRRHAVLRTRIGEGQKRRFTLADLGSSNGTFLRIRDEVCLRHGDHFRIGQQLLRFDISATHAGA
jgi:pSer/pThr/pTyr-binding forkhead associated (FHA) protein